MGWGDEERLCWDGVQYNRMKERTTPMKTWGTMI